MNCCGQLLSDTWAHCPRCGRYAGRLEVLEASPEYEVAAGRSTEKTLRIQNVGPRPITYKARIESNGCVQLVGSPVGEVPQGEHGITIRINSIPPPDRPASLFLESADGERPADDPWAPPQDRKHPPILLRIKGVPTPQLEIMPQFLVLTPERPQRDLVLTNRGKADFQVTLPPTPPGFDYFGSFRSGASVLVPRQSQVSVPVVVSGPSRSARGTAIFKPDLGQPVSVEFRRTGAVAKRALPAFIIGIDFGTRNSSIYVRRVRRGKQEDEIEAVPVGKDRVTRFPSALYKASDGSWHFGPDAILRAQSDGRPGDVVRGIKTLIRSQEEPYLHLGVEFGRFRLLTRFLRNVREAAKEFILTRWANELKADSNGKIDFDGMEVLYVCTTPVLDDTRREAVQREMARAARQALLPAEVAASLEALPPELRAAEETKWLQFATEPLAAALYIILKCKNVQVTVGNRIVVFDSGGGTTDIVEGKVTSDESGQLGLELGPEIGLDDQGRTFGGDNVTDTLINPVLVLKTDVVRRFLADRGANMARKQADALLHELTDPLKMAAILGDQKKAELVLLVSPADPGAQVTEADVNEATKTRLESVLKPVHDQLFEEQNGQPARLKQEQITYVFPVGGNALIPYLRSRLADVFDINDLQESGRMVKLAVDEVMEAVARGAVLVPDARLKNAAAYTLDLHRHAGAASQQVWSLAANSTFRERTFKRNELFDQQDQRITVKATVADASGVVAEGEIVPPSPTDSDYSLVIRQFVGATGPAVSVHYNLFDPAGDPLPELHLFTYLI